MRTVTINVNTISPKLRGVIGRLSSMRPVYQAGASELARQLNLHLERLQARGNEKGWPSRKFFAGGMDSVANNIKVAQVNNDGATVKIADYRFTHRIKGGTVTPKKAGALAIPLTARSYAAGSPRNMPVLTLKNGFLVAGRTKHFFLTKSVTHKPKPHERPDGRTIGPPVRKVIKQVLMDHLRK